MWLEQDYTESLEVLSNTGILHRIFANSASGLPLEVQKNEKKFKLLFLDIGLLPQANASFIIDAKDINTMNGGNVAEHFVGQELIAYENPYSRPNLFYWEREKKGAEAEVDYVIQIDQQIIPIEVKAGQRGSLRSLKEFMLEKKSKLGLRISQAQLSFNQDILSVPFYMIHEIPRLVRNELEKGTSVQGEH